jgi:hypothetical protein
MLLVLPNIHLVLVIRMIPAVPTATKLQYGLHKPFWYEGLGKRQATANQAFGGKERIESFAGVLANTNNYACNYVQLWRQRHMFLGLQPLPEGGT